MVLGITVVKARLLHRMRPVYSLSNYWVLHEFQTRMYKSRVI